MEPSRSGRWLAALVLGCCGLLVACAPLPPAPPVPVALLQDDGFAPAGNLPAVPTAAEIFALSPEMKAFADRELGRIRVGRESSHDPRRELIAALYNVRGLQLHYDNSRTRNAAEAFAARSGNCLSLVIMTAAFARHLDLPVSYQQVDTPDYYSRNGQLTMSSGHVNLVLAPFRPQNVRATLVHNDIESLTIDFLPQGELRGQRSRTLPEQTLVAMFLNNRAVEHLAEGRLPEAYAHARAALLQDPGFRAAANTLGVVFSHAAQDAAAERAFRHVLAGEPSSVSALTNLQQLLRRQGRSNEADEVTTRLARLQPVAPFEILQQGREVLQQGDAQAALQLFQRELQLQPYQDEVHFWLAQAYLQLGQGGRAQRHLALAAEYSTTRSGQERYSGKLARLRGTQVQ